MLSSPASTTTLSSAAPVPETWRARLLVIDVRPEDRAALYAAWKARGAVVRIETSFVEALNRIDVVATPVEERFTLVLVPVSGRREFGARGIYIGDLIEEWARDNNAPNYEGRFVCYGASEELETFIPSEARATARTIVSPPSPTADDVQRASEALNQHIISLASRRRSTRR